MVNDELRVQRLQPARVHPLRTRILRPGAQALCVFEQDHHPDTHHYGLVGTDEEPRAVLTCFPATAPAQLETNAPSLRLRGLCVEESFRGQGQGRRLLEAALARLCVAFPSAEILWCNARTGAAGFYEACGFERAGPVFDVPTIGPHVIMWKPMPTALA